MAFQRPSLQTIINRMQADLESRLTTAQLRRSNAKVYARVMAGASHALHGFIEYMARQMFFDTAEAEYLDRWASIYGIARKQASSATGAVQFKFVSSPVEVPIGTLLQTENGQQFETTAPVTGATAKVKALQPGAEGNVESGDVLTLISPVSGVYSTATALGIAGGANIESDDNLRSRLLSLVRERPHAGTTADYEAWALDVPGVTRAWVYPLEQGEGSVVVRFVCDDLEDIVPAGQMIQNVQAYLDSVRPVTARVFVLPPVISPVNFTIADLEPDDESVKARIKEALVELFRRESVPGQRIYLSHIRAAISAATGEVDHTLISPSADVVPESGALLTVGTIVWQ